MAKWYLTRDGSEYGPLSAQQLKTIAAKGRLRPDSLIRHEDMAAPRPAREIQGLSFTEVPEAPTVAPGTQLESPSSAPSDPIVASPPFDGLRSGWFGLTELQRNAISAAAGAGAVIALMLFLGLMSSAGELLSLGDGPKLAAFREVVAHYQETPDDLASTAEREKHRLELNRLQQKFFDVPFNPDENREQARAIVELFEQEIEHRYKGLAPMDLETHIQAKIVYPLTD